MSSNVSRETLASVLDEIALLLEIEGENPFKIRAYRQGAETVRSYDGDIVAMAREGELEGIKGIGKALQDKLHELATTGTLGFHQNLRGNYPETFFELFEIDGLGPKKVAAVHKKLGIDSIDGLRKACEASELAALSGFGKKTEQKILEAIARREQFADRFHLDAAAHAASVILARLKEHPDVLRAQYAGSLRRSKETVGDLDFIVATSKPAELTRYFAEMDLTDHVIVHGDTKCSIHLENGLQCDLRAVSNDEYPFALQYFTGSKEHNVALRSRALKQGLSLNEYGFSGSSEIPEVHEERDIYSALGLDYVDPALRENRGEIEAAEAGTLPELVSWEQLCGTFHNHTTASDGRDTLHEMAEAAIDLGLTYLGIADHSKSSFQARGLDEERLLTQIEEISAWNSEHGESLRIFAGSEVDILKDGSLDFDDSLLAQLDYCVASVHNAFTLDEKTMTQRIIRAMENEHVTMLGHLTGRLLLKRDEYAVNHDKIIDCAAETRTIVELNCNPRRLDMDWRWWKKARDKGVRCSINPDAHRTEQFQYLRFGADVARKGWLRKQDVINTMNLEEVEAFLALPKSSR
ncbi:DNA polymerase/3'-5' exonuclease PolX [Haloferula rosea]|uniref:DNA polymerase beta n=1 Tax=Haloferula rosea TaxID=490093 RepID=A0A934R8Y8_9BACT|nr:DNA polymerase/3'-5' exonuclease PolX [Haloferula rosea]MBK1826105.1 DNA polymerase/3'-5' exonuclease PolX [Haloferula rosea]